MHKYFLATLFTSICTVLSLKFFTHFLSVEEFGIFAFLQSFFIVISSFFSRFITQGIFKFFNSDKSISYRKDLFKVLSKYLILSIVLTILIYISLLYFFEFKQLQEYIVVTFLITVVTLLIDIQNAYYQASFKSNKFLTSEIVRSLLKLVLPIGTYILFNHSFIFFLVGHLLAITITIIPQYFRFFKFGIVNQIRKYNSSINSLSKTILVYSMPISIWYLLTQIINYIDRILLVDIYGLDIIGKYSANFSVFTFASQIIAIPLINSVHPKLLQYNIQSSSEKLVFEESLEKYTKWYIYSQFTLVGLISLFHKEITLIILNKDYLLPYSEISILVFGYSFWTLGSLGNKQFEVIGATNLMLLSLFTCFLLYFPILYSLKLYFGTYSIFSSKAIMYFLYPISQFIINKQFNKKGIQIKWSPDVRTIVTITLLWMVTGYVFIFLENQIILSIFFVWFLKIIASILVLFISLKFLIGFPFLKDFVSVFRKNPNTASS